MRCPFCSSIDTFVKDSRDTEDGSVIRRRRYCKNCDMRFTTFERMQLKEIVVIKQSGAKKLFDRNKIFKAISTAVRKRNISEEQIEAIVHKIIMKIENSNSREIHTKTIGELVMQELFHIDQVAYIRFASVYQDFNSTKDFVQFVHKLDIM
ncbi:MAG: transcriptional regulator NrdR [Rickettsiaceae bacterium]